VGVWVPVEAVARVDVGLLEALLEGVDVRAQMAVVVLEAIGVASGRRAARYAVGGLALGVRVDAGTAAAGLGVAFDLANLGSSGEFCERRKGDTLQRSQAWPVRGEDLSRLLMARL
jgi:hypothetical protein